MLKLKLKSKLTPADEHVDDEVSVLGEDDDEQRVQVQTLHQQPKEVGHDEVLEKHQTGFTSHLENTQMERMNPRVIVPYRPVVYMLLVLFAGLCVTVCWFLIGQRS